MSTGSPAPRPQPPASGADRTLADVGEFGLLDLLLPAFSQGDDVLLGPGDDAAVVAVPGGRVVVATDVLVEGRHFRRDWSGAADVGHRAAAQSLSDLNAMGGRAAAVTVGLAAPAELPVAWVLELAAGLAEECALVGASVVGGDLTRSDVLVVSVTAVGSVAGEPLRRGGARPGDLVAVRGRLGWAAAGLAVLGRGFRSPRAVVEAYRRPEVPYEAGADALRRGATSLIDVSDGLLGDLAHVARASEVRIDLERARFAVDDPLAAVGAALGVDPLTFVLGGGDDHALAATFPPGAELGEGWRTGGRVADGPPEVTVDGAAYEGEAGYRHFG
jgi:thiamine-monophosphate kinase